MLGIPSFRLDSPIDAGLCNRSLGGKQFTGTNQLSPRRIFRLIFTYKDNRENKGDGGDTEENNRRSAQ